MQIDEAMYEQTKNPINPETTVHITAIQNADSLYNIDWYQTTWEDLRKPLYSAIATYLYIFDQVWKHSCPLGSFNYLVLLHSSPRKKL